MAGGGYGRGAGIPLKDRVRAGQHAETAPGSAMAEPQPGRHCWITLPVDVSQPRPGLLLEWRRAGHLWEGRVIYADSERLVTREVDYGLSLLRLEIALTMLRRDGDGVDPNAELMRGAGPSIRGARPATPRTVMGSSLQFRSRSRSQWRRPAPALRAMH